VTDPIRRGAAEFIGTFALIFVGAGAVMSDPTLVNIALAHGLVIAAMVSAVGHISGGHFNPSVTLGFLVTGRLAPILAGVYWFSQFGGAVVAALLLRWIYPDAVVDRARWYVGPAVGGAVAALRYEHLYLRPLAPVPVGPPETGVEEPRPGQAAAEKHSYSGFDPLVSAPCCSRRCRRDRRSDSALSDSHSSSSRSSRPS
jgi:hypothetical protein